MARLGPPARTALCAVLALALAGVRADAVAEPGAELTELVREPFTGDLDEMLARQRVRVLVVPGLTSYFVDRGTQRGLSYDLGRALEDELNRGRPRKDGRVEVIFVPAHRDALLPDLLEGRADLALANLTITPERQAVVDFSVPLLDDVKEIVVTGPASPRIDTVDDLAGQRVFVRASSSYFQSLARLSTAFAEQGRPGIAFEIAPEEIEDEDILEMLNAGLVELAVVDDHKAQFWTRVFPDIQIHPDLAVRTGGAIGWAFRKDSPKLAARVNAFVARHRKGTAFGNQKFQEYLRSLKYVTRAGSESERRKLFELIAIFQRYSSQYEFDWIMMAAQGYQESRLDQNARSPVGAIGIMQVMPATGKDLDVGDIRQREPNIHAGTKYLRLLVDEYFDDPGIDATNRMLFAFAGYNAGPNRVARLRTKAAEQGLDPDVWFGNVERVVAREVGQEPVRYVANIFKYYVAYKLLVERRQDREAATDAAEAAVGNR